MSNSASSYKKLRWIAVVIVLAAVIVFIPRFLPKNQEPEIIKPVPFEYTPPDNREIIPQPTGTKILPDSSRIYLIGGPGAKLSATFKKQREVKVDGDLFFEVEDAGKPMIVRTRLLHLTVVGKSVFRVIAYHKENGEEVQVISGNIRVKKAYKSEFSEPDTLRDNQMVMINITIDLMEKEKFDTKDLRAWRDTMRIPPVQEIP